MARNEGVALIAPIKNEMLRIEEFVEGLEDALPHVDEVVLVDGGSTDGTYGYLARWSERYVERQIKVLQSPGMNIAASRNMAIRECTSELILSTDAGCRMQKGWAELMVEAADLHPGAPALKGGYRGIGFGAVGKASAAVLVARPDDLRRKKVLPSSRSFAVRRWAWERVAGYPEGLATGEDTAFALGIGELGSIPYVPGAQVEWYMRESVRELITQYKRYGIGDAVAGQNQVHQRKVVAVYTCSAAAAIVDRRLAGALVAAYICYRVRRRSFPRYVSAVAAMPIVIVVSDLSRVYGSLVGSVRRPKGLW